MILTSNELRELGQLPITYIVYPLIPVGGYTMLVADPAVGKTWDACSLAVCIETGTPWLGAPTVQARVLYVAGEFGKDKIPQRLHALHQGMGVEPSDELLVENHSIPIDTEEGLARYDELIQRYGLNVIIIDPLISCLAETDENNNNQVRIVMDAFSAMLGKHDCTAVIAHHTAKVGRHDVYSSRGAGDWSGGTGSVINLTKGRGQRDGEFTVSQSKMSSSENAGSIKVKLDIEKHRVGMQLFYESARLTTSPMDASEAHEEKLQEIVTVLEEHSPMKKADLLEAMGYKRDNQDFDRVFKQGVKDKVLDNPKFGVYALKN